MIFVFIFLFKIFSTSLAWKYFAGLAKLKSPILILWPISRFLLAIIPLAYDVYIELIEPEHFYYPTWWHWDGAIKKPLIYFYPEQETDIKVKLDVKWELIADFPEYDEEIKGWEITAYPNGKIIEDEKEYSYLFWEANFDDNSWDLSKWFIIEWKDSREFLQEKLSYIGLTPKEYNEFIVYWYPKMMNNKYNLVYFAWEDYTSRALLNIEPQPDSILRVFTVIKPLNEKIEIEEQKLKIFERTGFSVIEWGGTILE